MVSFRAKIRVIPNVSYERALLCTIIYIYIYIYIYATNTPLQTTKPTLTALRSATTGVVTAVTITGLPVTIAASVVSGVLGIISIILKSFQKKYHKESIKEK